MAESFYNTKIVPQGTENHYWVTAVLTMREHMEIPAFFSVIYLLAIFIGPRIMASRERLNVKPLALFWNGSLAIFSILGAYFYVYQTLVPYILTHGFPRELCTVETEYSNPWVYLFCLSKIPELFDTVLHVLKKQSFIFLHWYHHVTVMWFCWFAWAYGIENGGLFAGMNLIVHSVMYSFYTLGTAGVRFPTPVMIFITSLQILQMVFGTAIVGHNILYCNHNPQIQMAGFLMYVSYGLLFIQYFVSKYFRGSSNKKDGHGHTHAKGDHSHSHAKAS